MTSSTEFSQRDLYGGAISALIPSEYIDASDLRQIPDHQEVFLSAQTLTSIIFELNDYQVPSASAVDAHINIRRSSTSQADDEGASTHHFLDPIASPDRLDPDSSDLTPQKVTMGSASLGKFPAYRQVGTILSPGRVVDRTTRSVLPPQWATDPTTTDTQSPTGARGGAQTETVCYQLLVRLRPYGTDLCVRVNVPCREFVTDDTGNQQSSSSSSARANEEALAQQILQHIIASLDVRDFGLFVTDD